jgi:hypothetical protein
MTASRSALVIATALIALTLSPAAAAHGGGGALGFTSTVTAIIPADDGIRAQVLDSDDRIELVNETGREIVILGYEKEPYLAFRDGQVLRNTRSPATYLNEDRFADVDLPAEADPKAPPEWEVVAEREAFDWHDHRIHWMSEDLPPRVAATRDEAQHVYDWEIPATLDGEALAIEGSLDYAPPPSGNPVGLMIGFAVAIALLAGAALLFRVRRARIR